MLGFVVPLAVAVLFQELCIGVEMGNSGGARDCGLGGYTMGLQGSKAGG
jgi:hypothetical protein